jgi:uncharacterized membrane protein
MFFSPFTILFFLLFLLGLIFLFIFIHVGIITIAFSKIGLTEGQVFAFLLVSLVGSHINIPVKRLRGRTPPALPPQVSYFGIRYRVPPHMESDTVVAINLGGAIVPIMLSLHLMLKWGLFFEPMLATLAVASICYFLARPVPGIGIALPLFVAPLMAALIALIFSDSAHAPVVAYIAGTMGTLIGADILHLKDIPKIQAPLISIGGAGTFDGIFLTGIIAVLLA